MVWHYSDDVLRVDDLNGGKFSDWLIKRDNLSEYMNGLNDLLLV